MLKSLPWTVRLPQGVQTPLHFLIAVLHCLLRKRMALQSFSAGENVSIGSKLCHCRKFFETNHCNDFRK